MSCYRKLLAYFLTVLLLVSVLTSAPAIYAQEPSEIKNVIYMIPDGGGFALFDLANAVKEEGGFNQGLYPNSTKVETGAMYLKDYLVGTETTFSADSEVTDSAASGTALSSGYKTKNGYIGVDPQGKPHATILEASQLEGKLTGICTTYEWTHATPAAFTAHNISRTNYSTMSEQIVNQGLDVVLGVGFGKAQWGSISEAENRGYSIVNNKTELASITAGSKIWGNLSNNDFPFDINLIATQPTLAEMTEAAIRALDYGENGFFLMVEGSKVDAGGHSNNIVQAVSEYLAFDAAFKVAVEYAKNRTDTVVVALPDHDTGGLNLPNADIVGGNVNSADYAEAVNEVRAGINSTNGISWTTDYHTARNCGIWLYVPDGIEPPEGLAKIPGDTPENRARTVDNTDVAKYIAGLLKLDLESATDELYVDVTDDGVYDTVNGVFKFREEDVRMRANTAVAVVNGRQVDTDGKIAVFSGKRFYVPKSIIPRYSHVNPDTKAVSYIDPENGKILIKGQFDASKSGELITLILNKKSLEKVQQSDIGYMDDTFISKDGSYSFAFEFDGNMDEYEIKMYINGQTATESVTSVTASYSWLDSALELSYGENGVITGETAIKNYHNIEGLTYILCLGFYNDKNRLLGIKMKSPDDGLWIGVTRDFLDVSPPEGTKEVKGFILANYSQMIPLGESDTLITSP